MLCAGCRHATSRHVLSNRAHDVNRPAQDARTADPRVRGLDFQSFLIMPIQRIPRYELLLQACRGLATAAAEAAACARACLPPRLRLRG